MTYFMDELNAVNEFCLFDRNAVVGHHYLRTVNEGRSLEEYGEAPPPKRVKLEPPSDRFPVSDETWEGAYDASKNAASEKAQIEGSGRIFFDAIMTEEEIETQTRSGKKNTEKFDERKVRWIKGSFC